MCTIYYKDDFGMKHLACISKTDLPFYRDRFYEVEVESEEETSWL